ncbi:hypothetical protein RMSM_05243 [Rhodopirellula maiorica SM1]|uniref:Uncharacterized protein n=1 Tax=Rhodopirellula maiorica SM1 TaxID=1265738 RepID=M5REF2_9BACT|nr:hypothetical protein RMSM_05243 [Rhodopirellula maiorica SM1]
MKELATKIGLNELNRVAITCNACGTTVEINICKFAGTFSRKTCIACNKEILEEDRVFESLSKLMSGLSSAANSVLNHASVKFIIRENPESSGEETEKCTKTTNTTEPSKDL